MRTVELRSMKGHGHGFVPPVPEIKRCAHGTALDSEEECEGCNRQLEA